MPPLCLGWNQDTAGNERYLKWSALFLYKNFPLWFPAGGSNKQNKHKMKLTPYLMDAAPAITAATVTEIPDFNPYIQAVILIISGITALVRLFQTTRKQPKNEE